MKSSAPKKALKAGKSEAPKKGCVQADCKSLAASDGFCRLHYLQNWKHIKFNEHVKAERRLNSYVDRIAKRYPRDFMEKIKEGLEDANKFKESVDELDIEPVSEEKETDNQFLEKFLRTVKPGQE